MHPARHLLGGPPTGPARRRRRHVGGKLQSGAQPLVAVPSLGEEHGDQLADRVTGLGTAGTRLRAGFPSSSRDLRHERLFADRVLRAAWLGLRAGHVNPARAVPVQDECLVSSTCGGAGPRPQALTEPPVNTHKSSRKRKSANPSSELNLIVIRATAHPQRATAGPNRDEVARGARSAESGSPVRRGLPPSSLACRAHSSRRCGERHPMSW